MKPALSIVAVAILIAAVPSAARPALLVDGFSSSSPLSKLWAVESDSTDTVAAVIDYSTIPSAFGEGIPEAPNSSTIGGPSTTGVYFAANQFTGAPAAVGLRSLRSFDLARFDFRFDVFLSTGSSALAAVRLTETVTWSAGKTADMPVSYAVRDSVNTGLWGWLATENGFLLQDAALYQGARLLADWGETVDVESHALFNAAFGRDAGIPRHSPLNDWVTVRVLYDGSRVDTFFNGVRFFSEEADPVIGHFYVGYADPFASISSSPVYQWGVIDNVVLTVPEPHACALIFVISAVLWAQGRGSRTNAVSSCGHDGHAIQWQ